MDVRDLVQAKARAARDAARALALCPTKIKNDALVQMAHGLVEKTGALLEANRADVERARARGATRAFLDRLTLTESRLEEMAQGLREIAALPDPVGTVVETWGRPSGIEISRVRVPLGVVGFIYESRPNVTADAAGLCLKSGNAAILRGGREASESNTMIAAVLRSEEHTSELQSRGHHSFPTRRSSDLGTVVETWGRPSGIEISRVRVPLGVVGFIYESRPNVTADAAGLCLKSGNAAILRGGSEAIESNTMIAAVL